MPARKFVLITLFVCLIVGCGSSPPPEPVPGLKAFVGATVMDGTDSPPIENAVLVVQDGRVKALGTAEDLKVPPGAETIDVSGKFITPGFINFHGHVGAARGLESGPDVYTDENILSQLRLYARYGVTAVNSMGGDGEAAIGIRDAQETADLDRARIYVAGSVVSGNTPDEARAEVDANVAMKVDFIKIRVDDNLGTSKKMTPEVYQAVIDQAHTKGRRVEAHVYYLDDAKGLLNSDVDIIAHSVRDKEVDDELINLLKENDVCLCPTLTRDLSTFVYESVPEFFSDPFFTKEADPAVLEQLKDPERQAGVKASKSAQQYKKALEMAKTNLKKLADAGVTIAFGTDSGPRTRFQGYFEHMELDLMAEAGMTPTQILVAATGNPARCLKLPELGLLQSGKWADLNVFSEDPSADIKNTHSLESVWIAGNLVPDK